MRQGLRQVGRPGMGMLAAQSSVSEIGDLAVAHPDYLRQCDAHLVPMLNELKMDHRNIAKAVNSIEYGMRNASLACVIVGGLGGDAPGSAVVNVASFILANLTCLADYHICHPIDMRHVATSTRRVLWVESIVEQAFARNAPCIIVSDVYPKSGALTRELLYETAANAIAITVSGGHLEGCGSADGVLPNGTGLANEFSDIVGRTEVRYRDFINLVHRFRVDKDNLAVRRNEFDAVIGNQRTYAEIGYTKLNRDISGDIEDLRDREELRAAGRVAFARYWSLFGSAVINLTDRREDPVFGSDGFQPLRSRLGIAYQDDCLEVALTWRRDYAATGDARRGNSFQIRFALRNLGFR